ncbi:hypothetical protein [Pedobacter sp. SL55]|uniref:hypothetical protein n=1 Tax=Pedobacter sp. SL55 TaxID=2995161 RepID=UPI00226E5A51|nr:hypothetical protein [Pedobacter sp. SL55]WAC42173.1 hypothetical protein OVA16_07415 [Pedobacter sp. SL55]
MLLPALGFSQQEQPKRVSVVITAKAIVTEKEIVQIPADNTPIVTSPINTVPKGKAAPANKPGSINATTALQKQQAKSLNTKAQIPKPVVASASKKAQIETKQKAVEQTPHTNTASNVRTAITDTTLAKPNQTSNQLNRKDSSLAKSESIQRQNAAVTNGTKASSFSYIWIGSFLIIAGLVLGLLFGKPAFLISFVGVVFVVLGILI